MRHKPTTPEQKAKIKKWIDENIDEISLRMIAKGKMFLPQNDLIALLDRVKAKRVPRAPGVQ
jgi:hypothetical protein